MCATAVSGARVNKRQIKEKEGEKSIPIVYRYTDLDDNIVKYIGIVTSKNKTRTLEDRIKEHYTKHEWAYGNFKIDYFTVASRTDAEAFESHLISFYKTYLYYNKAKADWGLSQYLPNVNCWTHYITYYKNFSKDKNREPVKVYNHKVQNLNHIKHYKIFKYRNGYCTHVPDFTKSEGRRKVQRKTKEEIITYLNEFYGDSIYSEKDVEEL